MKNAALAACTAALARHRTSFERFTRPATDCLCAQLPDDAGRLLDVASGIGDPALAIAARLPSCALTATDLVPELLAALRREAKLRGLHNVQAQRADMHALPYASGSFQCVVSRLGLQQAHDPGLALREAQRVLCAGGRALYLVWGTPDQPLLLHTVLEPLARCGGPQFQVGEPGPFRFAADGALVRAAREQGLRVLSADAYEAPWCWPGSAEALWQATRETSAPLFDPLLARLPVREQTALEERVVAALRPYERDGRTTLPVFTRGLVVERA